MVNLQVRFDPLTTTYLQKRYPDGIRYDFTDNVSLFIFSLLRRPSPGEITKEEMNGVIIHLPNQFVNDGLVYLPDTLHKQVRTFIGNFIEQELFNELRVLLCNTPDKRFRGINSVIDVFMERYGLNRVADRERFKKAFYRYRQKHEKILGTIVPSRPLASTALK